LLYITPNSGVIVLIPPHTPTIKPIRRKKYNLDLKESRYRKNEFEYKKPKELVSTILKRENEILNLMNEINETIGK